MRLTPNGRPRRARDGLTLVELVVALALLAIVATMILETLRGQQRFQVGMLQIIDAKRNAHQAVELLYATLRGASSRDLYAVTDSSIAFRATVGASYICAIDSGRASMTLASADESALSTFQTTPRAGDSLLIFDPGDASTPDDDRWSTHTLTANPSGGLCPMRPIGLSTRVGGSQALSITITPAPTSNVFAGSPVRFFRHARFSLYRGSGGEWMLGYSTCAAGTCSARQPLSGPYLPFAPRHAGGVAFEYFDAQGSPTTGPASIARIEVVARTRTTSRISAGHFHEEYYTDSAAVTIALRNST
jgi:prepilin-type N-terminal cleavage/methylation domain-containing protein